MKEKLSFSTLSDQLYLSDRKSRYKRQSEICLLFFGSCNESIEMDDLFADQMAGSLPELNRSAGLAQLDMFLVRLALLMRRGGILIWGRAGIIWCRVCQVISDAGL